jgi:hypothetical protein
MYQHSGFVNQAKSDGPDPILQNRLPENDGKEMHLRHL